MTIRFLYKSILLTASLAVLWLLAAAAAFAQTYNIEISGNGSDSVNTAGLTATTTTEITQTNEAGVSNDISVNADTGSNTTSDNTGDQNGIATGDITTELSVINNLNSSSADVNNCCLGDLTIENSSNGSNSINEINSNVANSTNINISNFADVFNLININANTGENQANNNNGSVLITTGSIKINGEIKNGLNSAFVKASSGFGGNLLILNKSNGSNSINLLKVKISNDLDFKNINFANILNDVILNLNTGKNDADGNNGDVEISTGNIDVNFSIDNDANKSFVDINCCGAAGGPADGDDPGEPAPPANLPGPSSSSSPGDSSSVSPSSSSGPGSVLAALSQLPATGASYLLLALFALLASLLFGVMLRVLAGRSPPQIIFI